MSLRVIPLLTIASLACATGCTGTDSAVDSPAPPSSNAVADDDTTTSADTAVSQAPTSTIGASVDSASTDTGSSESDSDTVGASPISEDAEEPESTGQPEPSGPFADEYLSDYTLVDEAFGTEVTVTIANGRRTIQANALPNHATGTFPNAGNPNAISEQSNTWDFPAEPSWTGTATPVRVTGVALNGVKFEPGTAETISCSSGETLRIEALQNLYDLGFDMNNAHVQPTGEYHYHGISQLLVDVFDSEDDIALLGFAADGHLIAYSKSGQYRPGYTLSTDLRTGTGCVPSLRGADSVNLAGTTPDGTYTSDWVYSPDSGTLDECNGTTVDGTYLYFVTDSYPFIPRCLFGSFSETGGAGAGQPDAPAPPTAPGGPIDLSRAAAILGVSPEELRLALGPPPPDLEAAASALGVSLADLQSALGPPPG